MKLTDELLLQHAAEAREMVLAALPEELPPVSWSQSFARKMGKLIKQQRRSPRTNRFLRTMKQTVAAQWDAATNTVSFGEGADSGQIEILPGQSGVGPGNTVQEPKLGTKIGPFTEVAPRAEGEKGQTITRAFTLEEGAAFVQSFLRLDVEGIFDGQYHDTDITVKVTQYNKKG